MSSLYFAGDTTSYLRIPNTDEFDFGTGDFTIEWYQYQTDLRPFPRIFQVGTIGVGSGASIGVSIESGSFYYWTNGSSNLVKNIASASYRNKWVHFAICRSSGVTQVFMDGISIYSMSDTNNFNGVNDLIIGNESSRTNNAAFGGYIAYFSWIKGVALHTSNFTVPSDFPTATGDYRLLLTASSFGGTLGDTNTVENYNVSTVPELPPSFLPDTVTPKENNLRSMKSLFSNNAMVYYKRGSLAPGGVGSVRNSSVKSRKT